MPPSVQVASTAGWYSIVCSCPQAESTPNAIVTHATSASNVTILFSCLTSSVEKSNFVLYDYNINCGTLQSPVSKKQSKQKKCDPTHFAPGHGEKMKDK